MGQETILYFSPSGLVSAFIPSAGGISRSPCEFSKPENLAKGADAIFKRILKINQGYLQQHG